SHYDLLSRIIHYFIGRVRRRNANSVLLPDEDNTERPAREHSWKLALPIANGKGLLGIVPAKKNRGVDILLVVVVVVFVLVESELAIGTAIDSQLDRVSG